VSHRLCLRAACLALCLAGSVMAGAGDDTPPAEAWRTFAGTWSASGHRHTVAIEGGGVASVAAISGAVVLTTAEGLSRGFLGQAIAFEDGAAFSGRCVWTDEQGDHVFSRLSGEPLGTGKRVVASITGGTGRYAAFEGEFSFTWQYVVSAEEGLVQGRAVGLAGRVRRREPGR
jgi:hypothetical protein